MSVGILYVCLPVFAVSHLSLLSPLTLGLTEYIRLAYFGDNHIRGDISSRYTYIINNVQCEFTPDIDWRPLGMLAIGE